MDTLKSLSLIGGLTLLFLYGPTNAAYNSLTNLQKPLQGIILAHDTGYPHYHGDPVGGGGGAYGGGRIRSYGYCSRTVFEPCRRSGGSYRYCNRQHHLCTYGHTSNCIPGRTC